MGLSARKGIGKIITAKNYVGVITMEDGTTIEILPKIYSREQSTDFLPLKTKPTVETLAGIFADSIIPLLQEYFYEDYEKIRLVLGDNNKPNQEEQFIIAVANDYNELFGSIDYGFDEASTYEINAEAFENIEAYRLI